MSNPTTIDLGKKYGLRGKSLIGPAYDTPDILGSQLGWNASQAQARFPDFYDFAIGDLGWTSSDFLNRTYATCAVNDAGLQGYASGDVSYGRNNIIIPAGKWFYNSELRIGRGIVQGAGADMYFGKGATEMKRLATNWKSLYGAQNNSTYFGFCPWNYAGEAGTSIYPLAIGSGTEYCHNTMIRDLCMTGTAGPGGFNNSSFTESGFNYWWPGENSGWYNCLFVEHNNHGVLVSGAPAYAYSHLPSYFRNKVAGVGIRGCGRATMPMTFSGDFNPYMFYVFRQGETLQSPNGVPYYPCFQNITPGGSFPTSYAKIESFACRSGFASHSACIPDIPGKGQMLARLTGRFHWEQSGGSFFVHDGAVDSLIRVVDDYWDNGGTIPSSNSTVAITGVAPIRYAHWLHDVHNNRKFICNEADTDLHGSDFYWDALDPAVARNRGRNTTYAVQTATYKGIQPFKNDTAQITDPWTWNHNAAPTKGYNTVTGVAN